MVDPYVLVGEAHKNSFVGYPAFTELLLADSVIFEKSEYQARATRYQELVEFLIRALDVFRASVLRPGQESLKRLLLNDSEQRLPPAFYDSLPDAAWHIPRFFRTDESRAGRIFEVQFPGSGWGDLSILADLQSSGPGTFGTFDPVGSIVGDIQKICGKTDPSVLHLLDNASNPSSMRLLISRTQPPLKYWGYDQNVVHRGCDFVRSHSVYGLIAENLFTERLKNCAAGKCFFDLPPLMIFDQKMLFALPFLDESKDRFTDTDRNLFAYTYPVSSSGFRDHTGDWVSIDAFLMRPPKQRRYFLKYAGSDTSINWGSRGVYRLDNTKADATLRAAVADSTKSRPWILQPDVAEKEEITYLAREDCSRVTERLTCKYSSFYGPSGLIGVRSHHRKGTKVHGQTDTAVGLVRPV